MLETKTFQTIVIFLTNALSVDLMTTTTADISMIMITVTVTEMDTAMLDGITEDLIEDSIIGFTILGTTSIGVITPDRGEEMSMWAGIPGQGGMLE
jgi:hypothetical protein